MCGKGEEYLLLQQQFYTLDAESQRQVFFSFRQLVYRDIYFLLHDHPLTEDVIQESFMKAIARCPSISESSNLKAWLRKVSRNTAYDMLRKNKKNRHITEWSDVNIYEHPNERIAASLDVEETVEQILRNDALHEAIAELKYEYRLVLFLYYIEGLSYSEISREIGITEQVLTQRLARARKKLAVHFLAKWGDHHEGGE